jgi:DNA-binding NarL/FixJ family response regulator
MMIEFVSDLELVGAAQNGAEAVHMCRELQPDVALIGLHLSGLDGIAATRLIREESPHTKVIILTSSILPQDEQAVMQVGASEYLRKDIAVETIVAAIREVALPK